MSRKTGNGLLFICAGEPNICARGRLHKVGPELRQSGLSLDMVGFDGVRAGHTVEKDTRQFPNTLLVNIDRVIHVLMMKQLLKPSGVQDCGWHAIDHPDFSDLILCAEKLLGRLWPG